MNSPLKYSRKDLLTLAAVFGLLTGLTEGIEFLVLHQTHLLHWRLANRAIWYETLWIAPLVDFALFSAIGLLLVLADFIFKKISIKRIAWSLLIFLCIIDWTLIPLYGRLNLFAIVLLALGISVQLAEIGMRHEERLLKTVSNLLPRLAGLTFVIFIGLQGGGWTGEKLRTADLPVASADAPNIIVIVVDALRADHLSAYGYYRGTSPFIDDIAKEGTLFQQAISTSSWTQPSHASMLTGRYTYEHQAETKPLDGTYPTIGEILQAHGYRTGAFSGNTLFFTRRQGFGRGFLHFEDNYQTVEDAFLNSSIYGFVFDFYVLRKLLDYEGVPARKLAEDVNRSALRWIDQDTGKPFFVFMNYFDVHDPYTPPEPYRSKYASVQNPGGLINGFMERYHPDLTPNQLQSEIDAYDGSILYVDDQIKNLFAELDQRGLLENTIVIVTADHGESLGEHGLLQHSASLYIQEIHVPLVIWWPSHVPAEKIIDVPVTTAAIPATLLSLIKSSDETFPGPPLTELIFRDDAPSNWPNPISELAQARGAAEQNPSTYGEMKSVFGADMQYIVHEKFGEELYNWRVDPGEADNLIKDPSVETVLDAFKSYLKELIGDPLFRNP